MYLDVFSCVVDTRKIAIYKNELWSGLDQRAYKVTHIVDLIRSRGHEVMDEQLVDAFYPSPRTGSGILSSLDILNAFRFR